jgi:hypothetical protein
MRISSRIDRDTWVSMGCAGWLLVWLLVAPFVVAWLALKLAFVIIRLIVKGIVAIVRKIDGAPNVPAKLRRPPER